MMRTSRPEVCLLVVLGGLCCAEALAGTSKEAIVTINTARVDPDTPLCRGGAPTEGSPEAMLRYINDCPIGEGDLEVLRGAHQGPLRRLRDTVGDGTGELLDLIVELQSMRYRSGHTMFSASPRLSIQSAVARFYSVVEFNEASLEVNDLSLIRTAVQRLLELEVSPRQTSLGRQMMGRVRFVIERSAARCRGLADEARAARRREAGDIALLCEDLEVYGELASGFTALRAMVAYWKGYTSVVHWSRWNAEAPRRVADALRQKAALGVRIAAEEPSKGGRSRLLRASGMLLALSATSPQLEEVERARQQAFRLWGGIPERSRPAFAPYVRFVLLARVRLGLEQNANERSVIENNHLLNEALAIGDGLLQGTAENPFPGSLVEWPLIEREVRLTEAALALARHANAQPGRSEMAQGNTIMLGAARTLCHFFARERLEDPTRDEAIDLMTEALRQNRLGDLASAFRDHHQAPTRVHSFEVPTEVLEEVRKLEAALGDYARAPRRDRAGHLDGLIPLYEPLYRQLWFLQAIPHSGANALIQRLRRMMPAEVLQNTSLFQAGHRPRRPLEAHDLLHPPTEAWTGTRLDPVRGDYDLVPVLDEVSP